MGNSPSKDSQYAIQSTNKQTSGINAGLQQGGLAEEASAEPAEPEGSSGNYTGRGSQNISISGARDRGVWSRDRGSQCRRGSPYEMKLARGSGGGDSTACGSLSSLSGSSASSSGSTAASCTPCSSGSSSSGSSSNISLKGVDGSSLCEGGLPTIAEERSGGAGAGAGARGGENGESRLRKGSIVGCGGGSERTKASSNNGNNGRNYGGPGRIANPRTSPSVILRRSPQDPSMLDALNIDDAIDRLLHIGETRSYHVREIPFRSWEIQLICGTAREIFLEQPSLLRLHAPIKIVGDVHGQFTDLLRILKLSGVPHETNYLFLGDYVDRGKQSLETILLLLCYKIKYPDRFFMLRGNHESANVTKMYGFYDECKRRTSTKIWKHFIDVFNTLPFAAIVQDKIFCVHGGISPQLTNMKQIERIVRPTDIPEEGLLTDLLWSDPDPAVSDWALNDRGVSYIFGKRNVYEFCSNFKFDLVIRGHMVVEDGYEFFAKKKFVTIFSAPNYCGQFQNWGAVMSVTTGMMCSFELLKPHRMKDLKGTKGNPISAPTSATANNSLLPRKD